MSGPWPDPNSRVLSKIDFGVPLVELFKWLDVRDSLLGQNARKQNIKKALALARDCKHPDAVCLTSICEGKDVSTKEEAREVFRQQQASTNNDARALAFLWMLDDDGLKDVSLLRRAAEMGNAFACSTSVQFLQLEKKEEAFYSAQCAAAQHERDGFFWLGKCFGEGIGCDQDFHLAKQHLLVAAELGHTSAAENYAMSFDGSDTLRWVWLTRAASRGLTYFFARLFSIPVQQYFSGSGSASSVFLIGYALKGKIDSRKGKILGVQCDLSFIDSANRAVSFYESQFKAARLAVNTWTLVGIRLGIFKEIRKIIGTLIWDARVDATYAIPPVQIESNDLRRCLVQ